MYFNIFKQIYLYEYHIEVQLLGIRTCDTLAAAWCATDSRQAEVGIALLIVAPLKR